MRRFLVQVLFYSFAVSITLMHPLGRSPCRRRTIPKACRCCRSRIPSESNVELGRVHRAGPSQPGGGVRLPCRRRGAAGDAGRGLRALVPACARTSLPHRQRRRVLARVHWSARCSASPSKCPDPALLWLFVDSVVFGARLPRARLRVRVAAAASQRRRPASTDVVAPGPAPGVAEESVQSRTSACTRCTRSSRATPRRSRSAARPWLASEAWSTA